MKGIKYRNTEIFVVVKTNVKSFKNHSDSVTSGNIGGLEHHIE